MTDYCGASLEMSAVPGVDAKSAQQLQPAQGGIEPGKGEKPALHGVRFLPGRWARARRQTYRTFLLVIL